MKAPTALDQAEAGADGFAAIYGVHLLYETVPAIGHDRLLAALRDRCGQVEPMGDGSSGPFLFAHPGHGVTYSNGVVPAQTLIDHLPSAPDAAALGQALQQSWDWPDARSVVARCQSAVLVSDFMSGGLPYKDRLALVHKATLAVMAVAPCAAIHWRPSQRIVNPETYAASVAEGDPIFPAINVRLFNVANQGANETVMDSLGLAALGIPDVQCHFRDLDLNAMAGVLYNSACYLFEKGDVIDDGQTIQGLTADQRWRCRHEDALVAPDRVVLDLDPGPPHVVGDRG